ncbi:aryl hydrocarbon receptor spineless [Dermacentor variabilis]|uniref:aryl hydrocarbon receptor spineless n=1 Tax=Dermacentor variabilis TaxID=34621 RepID=UPI003F5C3C26
MSHLSAMYATKRRRRNSKSVRVAPKEGPNGQPVKSNPSKRHRERLNAELDTLASLLPFDQNVLSKLDKLSILRLSVSYLRTKSYFQASLHRNMERHDAHQHKSRELLYIESLVEGDLILQALNGFLLILTCDGEVFYASHTVETYLGFHQSDICHQSVYELVHSEDREELQRFLLWNSQLPSDRSAISLQEALLPENAQYLDRNFTVRFRCLLDNTSGFLRLDIQGKIRVLQGQNHKTEEPPLALFAVCTPFGPPSLLEMPQKESMFKSKHKLDLALVSMDQRGKQLLGYADSDFMSQGGYDLVHFDDLAYVASAHQELLKTGASGLIAYRLATKDGKWQWLQTSARLVYKNSKPDFILCTHRPLMEEEGRDLLGKRTMDFKVTYLDAGLTTSSSCSSTSSERNSAGSSSVGGGGASSGTNCNASAAGEVGGAPMSENDFILRCQRNRRYKSQIRDLLSRGKRSKGSSASKGPTPPPPPTAYSIEDYGNMYATAAAAPYAAAAAAAAAAGDSGLPPGYGVAQNLFLDNSRFLAPENFLHYRHLSGYYAPEYPQYGNGFLDPATRYTPYQEQKDDKLYACQLDKYNGVQAPKASCCDPYGAVLPDSRQLGFGSLSDCLLRPAKAAAVPAPKEDMTRQSVLMWGAPPPPPPPPPPPHPTPHPSGASAADPGCKWGGLASAPKTSSPHNSSSPVGARVAPTPYAAAPTYTHEMVPEGWQMEAMAPWRPHLPALG